MKKILSLMLCLSMLLGVFVLASCEKTPTPSNGGDNERKEQLKAELKNEFLKQADEVVVSGDSVTFKDATENSITIQKNPAKTVNLYASFTTLWYEAGGSVSGCIGGSSSQELYEEYIGRDITADAGMTVVATSSSGKNGTRKILLR